MTILDPLSAGLMIMCLLLANWFIAVCSAGVRLYVLVVDWVWVLYVCVFLFMKCVILGCVVPVLGCHVDGGLNGVYV